MLRKDQRRYLPPRFTGQIPVEGQEEVPGARWQQFVHVRDIHSTQLCFPVPHGTMAPSPNLCKLRHPSRAAPSLPPLISSPSTISSFLPSHSLILCCPLCPTPAPVAVSFRAASSPLAPPRRPPPYLFSTVSLQYTSTPWTHRFHY